MQVQHKEKDLFLNALPGAYQLDCIKACHNYRVLQRGD